MSEYHVPVLLKASVDGLNINPDGIYVDVTVGGGGHSREIVSKLNKGKLFGFDKDSDASKNKIESEKFVFIPEDFRHLKRFLRLHGVKKVDGIIGDLGVSWHQFNTPERGFSIRFDDSRLDMRMDSSQALDAITILNDYSEQELLRIFREYGELPGSFRLAASVVKRRKLKAFTTVGDLKQIALPFAKGKAGKYFAQLFQAIRIEVNGEMDALKALLEQSVEVLAPEGRLSIISYHSLEDRLTKRFMRSGRFDGVEEKDFYGQIIRPLTPINRKVIVPSAQEIEENSKARSAKLRIAERSIEIEIKD